MTTGLYAAVLAGLFVFLSVQVIRTRRRLRVGIGDGGNDELRRRIRVQGNFAEYAPFFIVMLWMAEAGGLPIYAIHGAGLLFLTGRFFHIRSLVDERYEDGRMVAGGANRVRGMMCTFAALGALSAILLVQYALSFMG